MTNLLQFTTDVWKFHKQHVIFAHELRSAPSLMVEFSNIYCELQQICHLNIKIKIKLTVTNFSLFVIIHNVFIFVD